MNLYEELDLSPLATQEEIKQRYRSLAQLHHPDRGGDEEKFKRIKLAYEVLINIESRKEYDSSGRIYSEGSPRYCAIEDICLLARNLIPTINPERDDLVVLMRNNVNGFRANISRNIQNHTNRINNVKKVIERIKRKDNGDNMIRQIAEMQLRQLQEESAVFNKELLVNDQMLLILDDYNYNIFGTP